MGRSLAGDDRRSRPLTAVGRDLRLWRPGRAFDRHGVAGAAGSLRQRLGRLRKRRPAAVSRRTQGPPAALLETAWTGRSPFRAARWHGLGQFPRRTHAVSRRYGFGLRPGAGLGQPAAERHGGGLRWHPLDGTRPGHPAVPGRAVPAPAAQRPEGQEAHRAQHPCRPAGVSVGCYRGRSHARGRRTGDPLPEEPGGSRGEDWADPRRRRGVSMVCQRFGPAAGVPRRAERRGGRARACRSCAGIRRRRWNVRSGRAASAP